MNNFNLYQQRPAWVKADQQAANIPNIKDKRAKRQQIHMLCETWKAALKGGA